MTMTIAEPIAEPDTEPAHRLRVPNGRECAEITWSPDDAVTVAEATQLFEQGLGRGFGAYKRVPGQPDETTRVFDPTATEIIMLPQLAGG